MKYSYILLSLFIISCGIEEILIPPDARTRYEKTLIDVDLATWEKLGLEALKDSINVELPYSEIIDLDSISAISAGYIVSIKSGTQLNISTNSTSVLIDVYHFTSDSLNTLLHFFEPKYLSDTYIVEILESGKYLVRIQPKLKTQHNLEINFEVEPIYQFPVSEGKNVDIGSFWGDSRDGGKRKHKGIDIFAKKGTPLIAVTNAKVRNVRNRGLGGKQIWLNDNKRNLNIYYAHLDSQYVKQGQLVYRGDTIGTVGNTGNAKNTPPHLHFGIYRSFSGAINPLNFVKHLKSKAVNPLAQNVIAGTFLEISQLNANFRSSPSNKSIVYKVLNQGQKVKIIGVTGNWYHVRDAHGQAGYLYKTSLTSLS